MIRILLRSAALAVLLMTPVAAQQYPAEPDDGVADLAGVIDPEEESEILATVRALRSGPGVEVVVLTVRRIARYGTGHSTHEAFATALYNHWALGAGYPGDGVLVMVSVDDRFARIEVGDNVPAAQRAQMQAIMDERMVPRFRAGEYGEGVVAGVQAIEAAFRAAPRSGLRRAGGWTLVGLALAALGAAGVITVRRRTPRRRPCPTCGRRMQLLDEAADDAHLDEGQRREEAIRSVNYDVWHCADCGVEHVIANPATATRNLRCPRCNYRTVTVSRTGMRVPTYEQEGAVNEVQECGHCDWRSEQVVVLPRRVRYVPAAPPADGSDLHSHDSHTRWRGGSFGGGWSGQGGSGGGGSGGGFSSGGGASGRW